MVVVQLCCDHNGEVCCHELTEDGYLVQEQIKEVEEQIADLKKRWPAHSLKPGMLYQLEELEDRLEYLKSCQA